MEPTKDQRSTVGVAIGGVLILVGAWLFLRTSGFVPSAIFEMLDRVSGPLALIVIGVVVVVVAQKAHAPAPGARLYRSRGDKWLGGVLGGLGPYLGIDPVVLRLAVIALTVAGFGPLVVAYLVGWVIIPEEPVGTTAPAAPAPPAPPAPPA